MASIARAALTHTAVQPLTDFLRHKRARKRCRLEKPLLRQTERSHQTLSERIHLPPIERGDRGPSENLVASQTNC